MRMIATLCVNRLILHDHLINFYLFHYLLYGD